MPKTKPQPGIYLSLDFGSKKIGVASGQTITQTATPLCCIAVGPSGIPWDKFDSLIETWRPTGIVVGLPLNEDGSHSKTSEKALEFCNTLKKRYSLPIFNVNEHLSSFEARQQLKDYKASHRTTVEVDAIAAAIILTSWFNETN
jgi:putative Holliday junction resolvase